MKLIFLILLFGLQQIFPQTANIVVITNPEIGPKINAVNLNEVVEDINKRQNVSGIVVLGNITANGKFDEFIWAQEILDQLTVPYFVVGGERDYLLSDGKGSEISSLWGDDKQFTSEKNFSLVGINIFHSIFPSRKFFDSETLHWLENKITSSQIHNLFTFSFYPLNSTENNDQLSEIIPGKKIFSFVSKADNSNSGKSTYEGLYLNRKDGWGYLLLSTKNDSIYIKKILSEDIKKKIKPEIEKTAFTKVTALTKNKPTSFFSAGSKIWSVSSNMVKITASVSDGKNIYNVFKNGLVNCIDASGKEIWHFETNKKISFSPLIENELLVIVSDDGDIISLDAKTGTSHQIISIGETITSGITVSAIDDFGTIEKSVFAGTENGNLYCYYLNTFDPVWTEQISGINSVLSVSSDIISSDNKIYFYDNEGTLYCLSASNGMLIWKLAASNAGWNVNKKLTASIVKCNLQLVGKELFLVDGPGSVFCIDALLGTLKWSIKNISAIGLIRFNFDQEIILPTAINKILTISIKQGKVTNETELPFETKDKSITDMQIIGGNIVIGFDDGWVYKIKVKHKAEKFFRGGIAPVISLNNVDGNCLVTDFDGRFTLLKLTP